MRKTVAELLRHQGAIVPINGWDHCRNHRFSVFIEHQGKLGEEGKFDLKCVRAGSRLRRQPEKIQLSACPGWCRKIIR